jgi:MFS family permease
MASKPDSSLYLLGKYLGLVFLLPSGAIAGYLLGGFAEHWLHWSWLRPAGIVLGIVGGFIKLLDELLRDAKRAEKNGSSQ